MERKILPIGIDNFEKLRSRDFYYVDKTGMIKELLSNWGEVNLFTRPRRFGKSLNMSMLKCFLEIGADSSLFEGLKISEEKELCERFMGKYPIVSVSFKGVEGKDFNRARNMMVDVINEEARRFSFLQDSPNLIPAEKELLSRLLDKNMDDTTIISSLRYLTELLRKHYGKKVIVLVDEYDVPLSKANDSGYYKQMVGLIRGMFHQALKTNPNVEFSVMTGCLRVSKESIFTGLNNPKMYTLLDGECDEQFGFTDQEVREMLAYYELDEYYDITKEWYDGYMIGDTNVYNPWDVINWCNQLLTNPNKVPQSFWVNSSENKEVQRFIQKMGNGLAKAEVEMLISGETVQKKIEPQLTYNTMYDNIDNMWSLLYATGYLTQSEVPHGNTVSLVIPNTEVRGIFRDVILEQFNKKISQDGVTVSAFCDALQEGNAKKVEEFLTVLIRDTVSIRDNAVQNSFKESFYHGILIGILRFKGDWAVASNQESGDGYYDIAVEIYDEEIGIVIEVKYAEKKQLESACQDALKQIDEDNYTEKLRRRELRVIYKYGIACRRNQCRVEVEVETLD